MESRKWKVSESKQKAEFFVFVLLPFPSFTGKVSPTDSEGAHALRSPEPLGAWRRSAGEGGAARRRCSGCDVHLAQRASHAQQPRPYTAWDQYGGSSDSMQYSALAQINGANVAQLQRAWFYPVPGEPERLVFNPLIVDNTMYVAGVRGVIVALDATTGQGTVDVDAAGDRARPGVLGEQGPLRPAADPDREQRHPRDRRAHRAADHDVRQQRVRRHAGRQPAPQRRAEQQPGSRLRESPHRRIERRRRLRFAARRHPRVRRPHRQARVDVPHDSAARRIRIRNVAADAYRYAGGANTWGDLTVDAKNGIVFLPTGSPTHDLYGGDRAATICSAIACSRSTRARESGCGIFRSCTTICGTTTTQRRQSC